MSNQVKIGSERTRIARAAGLVSGLTLVSRLLGLVREVVFAALLGAGFYSDAFRIAFRIPNLLRDMFAEGFGRDFVVAARDRCDYTIDRIRAVVSRRYKYIRNYHPHRPHLQPNAYKDNKLIYKRLRELHAEGKTLGVTEGDVLGLAMMKILRHFTGRTPFFGEWVQGFLGRVGMEEGESIESKYVSKQIEKAQKRVEERHFESRKNLLEYDEVMDHQRKYFYGRRQQVLEGRHIPDTIAGMKDSSGNFGNMVHNTQTFPGFAVISGSDEFLLPLLKEGGAGCITAVCNVAVSIAAEFTGNTTPGE